MKQEIIRIAIAEDHVMFRSILAATINSYKSFTVDIEAGDGTELIEKISAAKQLPDICILDISMKPMNGYETAGLIRSKWPAIKTLALTMFIDDFCIIGMLRKGARGFITKDRKPEELINALEKLYEKGFYHEGLDDEILFHAIQGETTYPPLTEKELEFLPYCCSDLHYREIAGLMHVSERTVESYRDSLFKKLNIKTRSGLATFAMLTGLGTDKILS